MNKKNNKRKKTINLVISKIIILIGIFSIIAFFQTFTQKNSDNYNVIYYCIFAIFIIKVSAIVLDWVFIWHPSKTRKPDLHRKYTVDILTTYVKGEPKDMLIKSLLAIKAISYPHESFLCDEDNDPELKSFCLANNIHHVTRTIKVNAKAGNINNALRTLAKGEIVLILDPDHITYPNFLDEVLPYFEDPKIGFVQVVQAYYNHNSTLIAKAAAEQTYQFYGPLMMTLNSYGAVPAIGANCTFRRSALDSIGGHAPGLTEDMHTTLQLRAKGWKSVYVPKIVAKGLVPWNYSGYCLQQLKWSRGSFELLFKIFPKLVKDLPLPQILAFLTIPFFYFLGVIALIDFSLPIISLLFNIKTLNINLFQFGFYYLQFLYVSTLIHFYHQKWYHEEHEKGMAILGGILFKSSWWATCLGLFYSILKKKVPYIPTPKEFETETPWKLLVPNFVIILLSIIAILHGLKTDLTPASIFMTVLALSNILTLSLGCIIAMQKQLEQIKNLLAGSFAKDSYVRKTFFNGRHLIYNTLNKNTLIIFSILFLISINIASSHLDLRWWYGNFTTKEFTLKLSAYLKVKGKPNLIYGKEYEQIYYGNELKKETQFYYNNTSFIKANFNLNKDSIFSINQFFDSCFINNIIPFVSLSVASQNIFSPVKNQNILTLNKLYKNIRERCMPVFVMINRDSSKISNDMYKKIYTKAIATADSLAVKEIITWIWHTKNIKNDEKLINYLKTYGYTIDWIFAENEKAYMYKNKLYGKDFTSVGTPLLIHESNIINTTQKEDIKNSSIENSIIGILGNKTNASNKLAFNLNNIFKKPSESDINKSYLSKYIKGVAYNPGEGGSNNQLYLTTKKLSADFKMIKEMGCNTIRRFAPSIYDYNLLKEAKHYDLDVLYGFWYKYNIDYYKDSLQLIKYKKSTLATIKKHQKDSSITSWGLGNEVWYSLDKHFGKPYLCVVRNSYLKFIRELIDEIKLTDSIRPVFCAEQQGSSMMYSMATYVPQIDFMGLNTYYDYNTKKIKQNARNYLNGIPYLVSEYGNDGYWSYEHTLFNENEQLIEPSSMQKSADFINIWNNYILPDRRNNLGGIAFCWQDKYEATATWFGLIDIFGNKKPAYYALKKAYTEQIQNNDIPPISLPEFKLSSRISDNGSGLVTLNFVRENNASDKYFYKWIIYEEKKFNLIKETDFENGKTSFSFHLPNKNKKYRVYLYLSDNCGNVITESTPVYFNGTNSMLSKK